VYQIHTDTGAEIDCLAKKFLYAVLKIVGFTCSGVTYHTISSPLYDFLYMFNFIMPTVNLKFTQDRYSSIASWGLFSISNFLLQVNIWDFFLKIEIGEDVIDLTFLEVYIHNLHLSYWAFDFVAEVLNRYCPTPKLCNLILNWECKRSFIRLNCSNILICCCCK